MNTHRSTGRPRAVLALLVLALVGALTACGSSDADTATSGTRPIETPRGTVSVPADPQRIVVLNGTLAAYLYDLDAKVAAADPRLLGVANKPGEFPTAWNEDAKKQGTQIVPSGDAINLEFIAAQRPDLIIGGGQGYPGQQTINAYDQLSAIAPTVLVPSDKTLWQDQLRYLADVVNKPTKVESLIANYNTKLAQAKSSIKAPQGATLVFQSAKNQKPTASIPSGALPQLLASVGFTLDTTAFAEAGSPTMPQAADYYNFSPELLSTVADAPNVVVIPLDGGRDVAALRNDPLYAQLPSFKTGGVFELPAASARPDYRTAMSTLDLLVARFK